jgi:hypothetical protein
VKRSRFIQRRIGSDPFVDLLFNALLGFTFLFLIALMFINPQARKGRIDLKAEYIISVTWPDQLADDIDLWVQDPLGETASYLRKDAGWLHLDRDDRGEINDTIIVDGKQVIYPINQEVVTIRGIISGEYTVNLYYYTQKSQQRFEALVKVEQETTVVRFSLDQQGNLSDVNNLPVTLTPYNLEPNYDNLENPYG